MPEANRLENLKSLRMANVDAALATAFGTLVTGTFLVGFIKHLGGADIWIGLLAAIPSLLGILQIPGGIIGRSFPSYKRFVLPGGLIWRLLYLPVIFLPLLAFDSTLRLWLLAGCVGLAAASVLFVTPVYNDWLAEMVPSNSRGWFFSRRNAIATGVGATAGLLGAVILDAFRGAKMEATGFTVVFAIGFAFAILSLIPYLKMHDLPRAEPIKQNLWDGIRAMKTPFADKTFNKVLVFLVVTVMGQAFAGNLFGAFALETLDLPFTIIQLCAFTHAAGNLITARFWGFLADKYGNKPILILVGVGLTLTPLMWLFCVPGATTRNAVILLTFHVLVGAIWAGVALCQFNILLATAKPADRSNYLGAALATQAITGGIAPLLGAELMSTLRGSMSAEMAYKWVFAVTMIIRFVAIFMLAPVREEGALKVRRALKDLSKVSPKGYRAMRELARSDDPEAREIAISDVGTKNFSLAADEIIKALHDPSPRVRRQAASSLAMLADPKAAQALIHMLEDHPDLVEEETVEALGLLGHASAVRPLSELLRSPRSIVRRAAAKALARIGSDQAIAPLMEAAKEPGDPDLRRASLQALRQLGAREAEGVIGDSLFDPTPSVRIAAAEAISELELRGSHAFVRQSLNYYDDEASCEVAYALGAIGNHDDIPAILRIAQKSVSIITRRRCLLGVARVLGVEREVYRLMLTEGMSRDAALLEQVKGVSKFNQRFHEALALYSSGREVEALSLLCEPDPVLRPLAEAPVEESFLIAACVMAKRVG
ncbi:MAG TPA: MFS transporter [Fimbriimonadaceae bacterium]|nr:MFS transporter [Fimbriimonadaceae bacterium]